MDLIQEISLRFISMLQSLSPMFDGLCRFIIYAGAVIVFILLIPVLYWTVDKKIAVNAFIALIFTTLICLALKPLLHQPRPYWLGAEQLIISINSYAVPSVYAANSLAVMGYLAYRINKEWLWAASGIFVALAGFSLMYLGMQFPTGVISGWLIGFMVVFCLVWIESPSATIWNNLSVPSKFAIVFGISILVVLVGAGTMYLYRSMLPPRSGYALGADSAEIIIAIGGAFFGAACGYLLIKKSFDYRARGTLKATALRCLLGFGGLTLIYFVMEWLVYSVPLPGEVAIYTMRYVQAAVCAFWVTCAAPCLFLKLNIARRTQRRLMVVK